MFRSNRRKLPVSYGKVKFVWTVTFRGRRSRNKFSVGEPAEGSFRVTVGKGNSFDAMFVLVWMTMKDRIAVNHTNNKPWSMISEYTTVKWEVCAIAVWWWNHCTFTSTSSVASYYSSTISFDDLLNLSILLRRGNLNNCEWYSNGEWKIMFTTNYFPVTRISCLKPMWFGEKQDYFFLRQQHALRMSSYFWYWIVKWMYLHSHKYYAFKTSREKVLWRNYEKNFEKRVKRILSCVKGSIFFQSCYV
jgi:hypothetical protein